MANIFFASPTGVEGSINKTITNITQANPAVVTSASHGLSNGQLVFIYGVVGMTEVHGKIFTVANVALNTFELSGVDSTGYTAYSSGGIARRPYLYVNSAIAGASNDDEIRIEETASPTNVTGANLTWTNNTNTIATSANISASFPAGSYIGRPIATGNGSLETFYRVSASTATTITIEARYKGTTGTDINSAYKLAPSTAMSNATANTPCFTISKYGLTISGGWNFTTNAQTGTTWMQPSSARTNSGSIGVNLGNYTNITLNKINLVESYNPLTSTNTTTTLSNMTITGGYYYCQCSGTVSNFICVGGSQVASSIGNLHVTDTVSFTSCYAISYVSTNYAAISCAVSCDLTGIIAYNSTVGVKPTAGDIIISNCTVTDSVTSGIYVTNTSVKINTATLTSTTGYGLTMSTGNPCVYAYNCSFTGFTQGIYIFQSYDMIIENCTFTNCANDINMSDQYSGNIHCINNTHTTPTTWAYTRLINSGIFYIYGDTIDGPSAAKAYNQVSGSNNGPQYVLQNAFGLYGEIYANYTKLRDTTNLSADGNYTIALKYNTTTANNFRDTKVASFYIGKGSTGTVTYELKATGVWAGTIIPKLKLDGSTIKTGTSITTVSNGSWDTQTISIDAGTITRDGELSLEFTYNANTIQIQVGDPVIA